jgi:SAM-dependent methyltransferase
MAPEARKRIRRDDLWSALTARRAAARAYGVSKELARREEEWARKGLLQRLYRDWYRQIAQRLSPVPGPTVELGSGTGRFSDVVPSAVLTDIEPTAYARRVVDAVELPFEIASVANLVLVDVFHHLAWPASFLDEATRVLVPGGRVVLLEPYCSPLSTLAYRYAHHEDVDLGADPFVDAPALAGSPWSANEALPTLAFFRRADELARRWPQLALVERRRLALFLWILSGGFSRPALAPAFLYRPLAALERALGPLAPLAGFRCLVVLERLAGEAGGPTRGSMGGGPRN